MEMKWGLVPDMGGMVLMKGLLRDDVVRDLTYTARIFDGEEALRLGLATRVCADPRAEALAYAAEIATKSPSAVRAAKRLLDAMGRLEQRDMLLEESREQAALIGSPHQVETVKAVMEKRSPVYAE
jgi:enoyl-CoA hydratase/carnithine racemase